MRKDSQNICDELIATVVCHVSALVLWAELPGAEICHLPGSTAIASLEEPGRTARASRTLSVR